MEKDLFLFRLCQKLRLDYIIHLGPLASLTWYSFCSKAENCTRLKRGKYLFGQTGMKSLCSIVSSQLFFNALNRLGSVVSTLFSFHPPGPSEFVDFFLFFWDWGLCDLKNENPINRHNIGGRLFIFFTLQVLF